MSFSPLTHIKWFVDPSRYPTDYSLLLSLPVLAAIVAALAAVGIAYLVERWVSEPGAVRLLERFAGVGPLALGLHVGVALAVAATLGLLFVPSLRVERDSAGSALLAGEFVCGVALALGLGTRPASVGLALLGVVAMVLFSFESILEQVHLLGAAVFLFVTGRGAVSIDRLLGQKRSLEHTEAPQAALFVLRIAMGLGIAYGALTEKLLDPGLAAALLEQRPELNILRGLGVADGQFAYLAGLTELVVGAVIISGWLTRPVMALGALLFTVTLPFFGWTELLGHLPYYGAMLTLFIAPNADSWRVRHALRSGVIAA